MANFAQPDLSVFSRVKTVNDFDRLNQEFEMKKQIAAQKMLSADRGDSLPAPLQLANEYQKRIQMGDTKGANLIMQFAKTQDKGLQVGADGSFTPLPGYAPAVSTIEGAKAGAKADAKNASDIDAAGPKKFNEKRGGGAGDITIKNDAASSSLKSLTSSIGQARELLPTVSATGPILGRTGALAEDPNYRNLQGALNAITLQAKDLYNLGSGQGFTDSDRNFLQEVIAGKYARAETIGMGLDRMERALANRNAFLQQQNKGYAEEFGGAAPTTPATAVFLGFE